MKHIYTTVVLAAIVLVPTVTTGCTDAMEDAPPASDGEIELGFSVAESAWEEQTVTVTRSGEETLKELQNSGFGVFCDALSMKNQEVKWEVEKGKWVYGTKKMLWPKNKVEKDLAIFAYAPYKKELELTKENSSIKFTCEENNTTDLLWASSKVNDNGIIALDFKHALAKLSFGSIVNLYGSAIKLTSVEIGGTFYTKGSFSLENGKWSDLKDPVAIAPISKDIEIKNGDAKLFGIEDILLLPDKDGTVDSNGTVDMKVTITIIINSNETINVTRDVQLKQGMNTEINLTVGQNHGVVIQ